MRKRTIFFILAAVLAVTASLFIGMVYGAHSARGTSLTCPVTGAGQWQRCIYVTHRVGEQITEAPTAPADTTPWMITDKSGAPMAWVNLYGLYSGGVKGLPGGLICVTYGVLKTVACMTPDGTLELSSDNGQTHETLTAQDIAWIHSHE
jgi:hypothetical protein